MRIEQFVYTTAEIGSRKGYQVVAKSDGISDAILDDLEPYAYPIDVDPAAFKESRSMVLLDGGLVAYSIIKNAGTGYDGRDNSICNHTFVISRDDFAAHGYDSRLLDKLYVEDKDARGVLPTMSADPPDLQPPMLTRKMDAVLDGALTSLFEGKKLALLVDDVHLPQYILALLPRSLRLVPFSTLVISPKKQPGYDFIMSSNLNPTQLGSDFTVVDPKKHTKETMDAKKSVSYYADLIRNQKYKEMDAIQSMFDSLPGANNMTKLDISCAYARYDNAEYDEKKTHAINVLNLLDGFDKDTHGYYYDKIKKHLPDEMRPEIGTKSGFDWLENLGGSLMFDSCESPHDKKQK